MSSTRRRLEHHRSTLLAAEAHQQSLASAVEHNCTLLEATKKSFQDLLVELEHEPSLHLNELGPSSSVTQHFQVQCTHLDVDATIPAPPDVEDAAAERAKIPGTARTPQPQVKHDAHFRHMVSEEMERAITTSSAHRTPKTWLQTAIAMTKPEQRIPLLDAAAGVLILGNALVMILKIESSGNQIAAALGETTTPWFSEISESSWLLSELIFAVLYLLELMIRLAVLRKRFFYSPWNLFDMVLVFINMLLIFILEPLSQRNFLNLTIVRLLRLAAITRSFRVLRTLNLFSGLRIILGAFHSSTIFMTWSFLFLLVYMAVVALVMVEILKPFIEDEDQSLEKRIWAFRHFGTSYWAFYSMFEITFSGGWPNIVRPLLEDVNPWLLCVFGPYVFSIVFSATRVVGAILLKETFKEADADMDAMMTEKFRRKNGVLMQLHTLFQELDQSADGKISKAEFMAVFNHPLVKDCLTSLDLQTQEGWFLFQLLDDGDGEIDFHEFLKSVLRLKGAARQFDILCIDAKLGHLENTTKQLLDLTKSLAT